MREPSITVPSSYFVKKSDWCLEATGGNEPAAELISVLLFHHDNRNANKVLVHLVERAIAKRPLSMRQLGDWMPYSLTYLRELLLMTHAQTSIIEGIKVLTRIKFIHIDCPMDIQSFYSKTHSWYKIDIDNIRKWIREVWFPLVNKPKIYPTQAKEVRLIIEEITQSENTEKIIEINPAPAPTVAPTDEPITEKLLNKQTNALCGFHKHIHAKNAAYVYDTERKMRVKVRLKSMSQAGVGEAVSIGMSAQAIIGNVLSDFHQARHPDNMLGVLNEQTGGKGKLYDDIGEYIFKSAKQFEKMIAYADAAGLTEAIALKEFQGFIAGKPSRFAKGNEKALEKAKSDAVMQASRGYADAVVRQYKNFAREVSPFFFTRVPNREILEMCEDNAALKKLGKGLTDTEFLAEKLSEAGKTFGGGRIVAEAEKQMREFSASFCEPRK